MRRARSITYQLKPQEGLRGRCSYVLTSSTGIPRYLARLTSTSLSDPAIYFVLGSCLSQDDQEVGIDRLYIERGDVIPKFGLPKKGPTNLHLKFQLWRLYYSPQVFDNEDNKSTAIKWVYIIYTGVGYQVVQERHRKNNYETTISKNKIVIFCYFTLTIFRRRPRRLIRTRNLESFGSIAEI